jgi:hypothetical protein
LNPAVSQQTFDWPQKIMSAEDQLNCDNDKKWVLWVFISAAASIKLI